MRQRDDHGATVTTNPADMSVPPICPFFFVVVNGAYVVRFDGGQQSGPPPTARPTRGRWRAGRLVYGRSAWGGAIGVH
jgi:hypothetical protein